MKRLICWIKGHPWTSQWSPAGDSTTFEAVVCDRCQKIAWVVPS